MTDMARREPVSFALGKVLDQSGYLQDLREDRSEDSESRIENLAELVSAAREYESREAEPSIGGFVDRLSLLSDADEEEQKARKDSSSLSCSSQASRKACSRTRDPAMTRKSSRKSVVCAMSE
jgi:superfamily I DNA/RNA helicase